MRTKFPSFSQWKQIFKVLKRREKIMLLAFSLLAVGSFIFLIANFYTSNTKVAPALGGNYVEGVVGQPRFINPIYGETNDVDRTLIDLTFSGLMTYDKDGKIVEDIASSHKISEDGKTYEFRIKDNIFWHDGKSLTADDVIFTIKTIQNSDYKSPLRANWIDVDIERVSDKSVKFRLKAPYNSFLENCTVKILPKHIWEKIPPENFTLSSYNLQPIGSGPFQFVSLEQAETGFIKTFNLESNRRYHKSPSFISNISFKFFENKEDLIHSAQAKEIDGFSISSLENGGNLSEKEVYNILNKSGNFFAYSFSLPRYFAVFFNNQKLSIFSDNNIRKALNYATNKEDLLKKISPEIPNGQSERTNMLVDSPILPDFFNYQKSSNVYNFDVEKAKELLDKSGFKDSGSGQREKTIKKEPAFQFKNYLRVGSKGKEVTELQNCLARLSDNFKIIIKDETSGTYGKATEEAVTEFQKKYLPDQTPTGETGKLTREKLNELCITKGPDSQPLKFILVTIKQPQLLEVANLIKSYWQNVGALVEINALSINDLKTVIKDRSYDALLYGEALGAEPDLYPFWHSSQKVNPGLNISSYESKEVDQLLKEARETLDFEVKKQKYEKLQDVIISDAPALFLYNPDYIYWVSPKIQGIETKKIIDPAKRFVNVTNWYLKTRRVWK